MMIAYCRLDCANSDTFIAIDKNDNPLSAKIVREMGKELQCDDLSEHTSFVASNDGVKIMNSGTLIIRALMTAPKKAAHGY